MAQLKARPASALKQAVRRLEEDTEVRRRVEAGFAFIEGGNEGLQRRDSRKRKTPDA